MARRSCARTGKLLRCGALYLRLTFSMSSSMRSHFFNTLLQVQACAGRPGRRVCWWSIGVIAMLFAVSSDASAEGPVPEPARIVILTGADPSQPAVFVQIKAIRDTLENSLSQTAEVYLDALDGFRFGEDELAPELLALMKKKYANRHVDLVVGLDNHAGDFALKYRDRIWPGSAVLLSSIPDEWFARRRLPDGFAHVPLRIDVTKTLAIAAALQPDAHRLVVIGGTTDPEYSLIGRVVKAASLGGSHWTVVEDWQGLPLHEIVQHLASLDRRTAVIYTTMYRDQIVPALVAASRAPIYAWYSTYLDGGITAGAVYDFEESARRTANAALAILRNGGSVAGLAFAPLSARCKANVTQMQRYGLSASMLPDNCELIAFPRSMLRECRGLVLAVLAVLLAQALTVVALLAQRRSRRLAQAEAIARRGELARAARFATVGELSASIAHEVGQPLGAILSNADAAELLVNAGHVDATELGEILADVKRDALRANEVVQRLRSLLQKQDIAFRPLVLDATLGCALKLIAPEAKRRNIMLEADFDAGDAEIMGDPVQLQQIVLNLSINAMDAMLETVIPERILKLTTQRVTNGIEITVSDRGCGLGAVSPQRLFEPFYTTKAHGMGLGLSIVRSIVEAHHGSINVSERYGGGTKFVIELPYACNATQARCIESTSANEPRKTHCAEASVQNPFS